MSPRRFDDDFAALQIARPVPGDCIWGRRLAYGGGAEQFKVLLR